jgi:hypothetical protein
MAIDFKSEKPGLLARFTTIEDGTLYSGSNNYWIRIQRRVYL